MTFGRIDDVVDASFDAWPDEPAGLGKKLGELALSLTGVSFPAARVLKILKDQFSPDSRFERVSYLIEALRLGIKSLEDGTDVRLKGLAAQTSAHTDAIKSIQTKIETPQFEEAVAVACEESARASSRAKVEQFARIVVGSLAPSEWRGIDEDVASMIRDIAQLGDSDLHALGILRFVHSAAIAANPNLHSADPFSRETPALKRAISSARIHPDDFLSTCERLTGFGLAAEVLRNTSQMGPDDYCYRPTRRGLVLLNYLEGK
jgi:hypothetical protein